MDTDDYQRAVDVWLQREYPVVVVRPRAEGGKLLARMPLAVAGIERGFPGRRPKWDGRFRAWIVARGQLSALAKHLLGCWPVVYVILSVRGELEVCAPACQNAKSDPIECRCACLGANHGHGGGAGWVEVSDAFAFRRGDRRIAVKRIQRRDQRQQTTDSRGLHRTVICRAPDGSTVQLDHGVADLVSACWSRGWRTRSSCQGGSAVYRPFVMFYEAGDAAELAELLEAGGIPCDLRGPTVRLGCAADLARAAAVIAQRPRAAAGANQ
jgi:hypothetical protein